jgi:hypothetical protein
MLEWSSISLSISLKLIVIENNYQLPILYLNNTQNYFLLEKLKSSTNYSLCLQTDEQYLCRNITTQNQQIISLSSKIFEQSPSSVIIDINYLIIAISFGIIIILLILFIIILFLIKQRQKLNQSSKTISIESYYQTTGSDTTCNNSIEERSTNSLHPHSTPIFCYCHVPSTSYPEQSQPYHLYHEIPFHKPPIII